MKIQAGVGTRRRGDRAKARDLRTQLRRLPARGPAGPRLPAAAIYSATPTITYWGSSDRRPKPRQIKDQLAAFLRDDLALELNADKTLITHARTRRGAVPRLRDHRPALRHEDHQRPPVGQREDRAARATGRDQGQMRPLPAPRQTLAPARAAEPGRLRHRRGPTGPNTGASSSTTCSPATSGGCTGCAGTPRRRC